MIDNLCIGTSLASRVLLRCASTARAAYVNVVISFSMRGENLAS